MPAAQVANRTPEMPGRCGGCFGAKGEIVAIGAWCRDVSELSDLTPESCRLIGMGHAFKRKRVRAKSRLAFRSKALANLESGDAVNGCLRHLPRARSGRP